MLATPEPDTPASLPPVADAAPMRAVCERILASPDFARAPRMARLLRYLVDQAVTGPARPPTEYAIGLDVFDRDPARYHPGEDPIVRVQVGRLRQRLQACQAADADPGGLRLRIPLGSYRPCLQRLPVPPGDAAPRAASAIGPGLRTDACDDDVLLLQPARVLQDSGEGRAFALGLHEELLTRMVQALGPAAVGEGPPEAADEPGPGPGPRTLVSVLRVDAERLRATVRLVEAPLNRVQWARQFDRPPRWGIDDQAALAESICQALREHLSPGPPPGARRPIP